MLATWIGTVFLILALSLQGCGFSQIRPGARPNNHQTITPSGPLDFSWKLSGDRSVAPVQVFSDATHTWLQWQPNQTLPAIFGAAGTDEQLASYVKSGPYTRIEGHWVSLVFRGAHQQARARRVQKTPETQVLGTESVSVASAAVSTAVLESTPASKKALPASPATLSSQPFYAITQSDKNLRQALSRWANLSGWKFQAEHWAVDVDIPLTATANFSDEFVSSVRALIEATELSERPLQPCFYANQVLRVVPITEACDRTIAEGVRA